MRETDIEKRNIETRFLTIFFLTEAVTGFKDVQKDSLVNFSVVKIMNGTTQTCECNQNDAMINSPMRPNLSSKKVILIPQRTFDYCAIIYFFADFRSHMLQKLCIFLEISPICAFISFSKRQSFWYDNETRWYVANHEFTKYIFQCVFSHPCTFIFTCGMYIVAFRRTPLQF